jgi:hypothetical protein
MAEGFKGKVYHDKKMQNRKRTITKYSWYRETKFCIIKSGYRKSPSENETAAKLKSLDSRLRGNDKE